MEHEERERRRARAFGFYSLCAWACLGTSLEAAHALKLSAYLDHPQRRELLAWGHAHGVGLALVVLAYAAVGIQGAQSLRWGGALRAGSLLVPLGFTTSIFGLGEVDPGPSIWLVPPGALLICCALFGIARSQTAPSTSPGQHPIDR